MIQLLHLFLTSHNHKQNIFIAVMKCDFNVPHNVIMQREFLGLYSDIFTGLFTTFIFVTFKYHFIRWWQEVYGWVGVCVTQGSKEIEILDCRKVFFFFAKAL